MSTPTRFIGLTLALSMVVLPVSAAQTSTTEEKKGAAETSLDESAEKKEKSATPSPWLFVPLFSSSPKLDTAAGMMVAYTHRFDEKSRPSMFGVSAKYTTSNSLIANAFAKTSFGEDHHRILGGVMVGDINNDYDNYLGSGKPLGTNDNYSFAFLRYLYRVEGDWFLGAQGAYSNYELQGKDPASDEILDEMGLVGYKSGGVGAVIMHDSRDSDFKATKGWYLNINNMAYREALGGEQDFNIYRVDYRGYWEHGDGNVFAVRSRHQFSSDAPVGAYSPVYLRGYTPGEYLAQHMSSIEVEERYKLAERWSATVFAGAACLYGDSTNGESLNCGDSENIYPAWGAGVQYLLKPETGIVVNLEYAKGKDDNQGVYLKMGYSF